MNNKMFIAQLLKAKKTLEANDEQMARHMRLKLSQYKAIEAGAMVLPLKDRKRLKKRFERLLSACGLN